MDRMLYVAMTGAQQTMQATAANNHNLANLNTTGFRADLSQFRSIPVFGEGHPTRVYAMAERPGVDFTPGPLQSTGRELDVAVQGEGGWLAVRSPSGGEAYTRAGNLKITSNGILTTGAGHPVLGEGGTIAIPPAQKIEIGADGTLSIRPLGQAANTLVVLDRIKLVNPPLDQLQKDEEGLMTMANGGQAPADASVSLVSGKLEASNASGVDALVEMIALARQYEMQTKMMQTAKELDTASAQMLRMG
ncbi:flagellar basal-body rod protein FlgF [Nitrosococcus watsonii]|uniref:Flagellar basal-body rod protein FlgF n=1 Tax=Nitrosococcus watsoni (strain C-113) TaxID=105559 RepID=D8K8D2_NITWC|nr:flagellar basal-body rod protein FlgF [Nitrosococcus watsonii]ADJ29052.1 flagellar basal-body rod protein FlgF [Nitrosococcus watsonii C-113]